MSGPRIVNLPGSPLTLQDIRELGTPDAADGVQVNAIVATLGVLLQRVEAVELSDQGEAFAKILRILESVPAVDRPRLINSAAIFFGLDLEDDSAPTVEP